MERKAALLHDTIEDTAATAEALLALGFRHEIVAAVLMVTKGPNDKPWPDETSEDAYFRKIAAIIESGNVVAMRVKLADNRHNADPARDRFVDFSASMGRKWVFVCCRQYLGKRVKQSQHAYGRSRHSPATNK